MTLADHLRSSPQLYPIGVDEKADAVQMTMLTRQEYEAASFLDRRLLTPERKTAWSLWPEFRDAAKGLQEKCHWIFHISHVGSTLLARLLGEHPAIFALREPNILRNLANISRQPETSTWTADEFEQRLGIYLGLWSRTFDPGQTSLIKATSFVCEMAHVLLARNRFARAIFMFVSPQVFLPTMLGGAMSDIDDLAESRLSRLSKRLTLPIPQSPGERVAAAWLCEMTAMQLAAKHLPQQMVWLDFDRFLREPSTQLNRMFNHLGIDTASAEIERILAGPIMRRYAKAPEVGYDQSQRAQILRDAEQTHAAEISRGLAWLDALAQRHPIVQDVISCR